MELPTGYRLQNVWTNKSPALKQEIIDFWLQAGALAPGGSAEKRVDEVFFLVRGSEGQIVAISTVHQRSIPQIRNRLYFFRCFVAEAHRRSHLATKLLMNDPSPR